MYLDIDHVESLYYNGLTTSEIANSLKATRSDVSSCIAIILNKRKTIEQDDLFQIKNIEQELFESIKLFEVVKTKELKNKIDALQHAYCKFCLTPQISAENPKSVYFQGIA